MLSVTPATTFATYVALLIVVSGCSAATGPIVDAAHDSGIGAPIACDGPALYCTLLFGECCDDIAFAQICREGVWVCDPCVLESLCATRLPTGLMRDCTRQARDAARLGMTVAEYCDYPDGG